MLFKGTAACHPFYPAHTENDLRRTEGRERAGGRLPPVPDGLSGRALRGAGDPAGALGRGETTHGPRVAREEITPLTPRPVIPHIPRQHSSLTNKFILL